MTIREHAVFRLRTLWLAVAVFEMVAIYASSSRSFSEDAAGVPAGTFNLLHFFAFAFMSGALALGFGGAFTSLKNPARPWVAGAVIATVYGLTDEFHQASVPGRYCSLFDLLVDGSGALFAAILGWSVFQLGGISSQKKAWLGLILICGILMALFGFRLFPDCDQLLERWFNA